LRSQNLACIHLVCGAAIFHPRLVWLKHVGF
jgi:hypothetical protein